MDIKTYTYITYDEISAMTELFGREEEIEGYWRERFFRNNLIPKPIPVPEWDDSKENENSS